MSWRRWEGGGEAMVDELEEVGGGGRQWWMSWRRWEGGGGNGG